MRNLKKVLSVLLVVVIMATAMVPAFAAETFTYETQAKALNSVGLFYGVNADKFEPDLGSALTREQGFTLIIRLLGKSADAKALAAADVEAALATFGDAKNVEPTLKNEVALAVKLGLVKGDGKNLDAKGAMLGKDFATVLLRQLGYADTEFAYDTATATLAEKGGLSTTEATKFGTKALIRDDLVGMAYGSLQAKYKTGETVIAKLIKDGVVKEADAITAGIIPKPTTATATATVTGAKKFTVAFNAAVDTTKVAVTVKKGSIAYNVAKLTPAADNKSVVVEMAAKIVKGDYELSVSGVNTDAIVAKVTAEDEKVAKITFPSDKAVMGRKADNSTDKQSLTVLYNIFNQYNEDITTSVTADKISVSVGTPDPTNKKITITSGSEYTIDQKVTTSILHIDTAVFASATFTVSDKATASDIAIKSLVLKDSKELDSDKGSVIGEYKLEVEAKDQFGNVITDDKVLENDIIVSVSAPDKVTVKGGTNVSGRVAAPDFEYNSSDKKMYISLATAPTLNYGTSKVTMISASTGKMSSFDVIVKEVSKVDTLTLQTPEFAVAKEEIIIPYTAVNQFGAEVTSYDVLKNVGVSANYGYAYWRPNYVTGKAELVLDEKNNPVTLPSGSTATNATKLDAKGTVVITATTPSTTLSPAKVTTISISVVDAAKPAVISGLTSDVKLALLQDGGSTTLKKDYIKVKDQYGRDYTGYTLSSSASDYRFSVKTGSSSYVSVMTSTYNNGSDTAYIGTSSNTVILSAAKNGSSTITIKLQKGDGSGDISGTEYVYNEKVVAKADVVSYELADIATVYDATLKPGSSEAATADYAKSVTVNGVLADGSKVTIPYSQTVGADTYYNYALRVIGNAAVVFNSGKISASAVDFGSDDSVKQLTVPVVASVFGANSATTVLTKNVTVSRETPKITAVTLVTNGKATLEGTGVISAKSTDISGTYDLTDFFADAVKTVDSYGVEHKNEDTYFTANNVVITNAKDANGNTIAVPVYNATSIAAGTTFNVTYFSADGVTITFKVIIK